VSILLNFYKYVYLFINDPLNCTTKSHESKHTIIYNTVDEYIIIHTVRKRSYKLIYEQSMLPLNSLVLLGKTLKEAITRIVNSSMVPRT
jgi:hypothetical protein